MGFGAADSGPLAMRALVMYSMAQTPIRDENGFARSPLRVESRTVRLRENPPIRRVGDDRHVVLGPLGRVLRRGGYGRALVSFPEAAFLPAVIGAGSGKQGQPTVGRVVLEPRCIG